MSKQEEYKTEAANRDGSSVASDQLVDLLAMEDVAEISAQSCSSVKRCLLNIWGPRLKRHRCHVDRLKLWLEGLEAGGYKFPEVPEQGEFAYLVQGTV